MPTMNAAQVRAQSVEDMVRWPELHVDQLRDEQYNDFAIRRSCGLFTRPEIHSHYYIEMPAPQGPLTTADVIMWLMAVRDLEMRAGKEAGIIINNDGIEASFQFSRPTTELERTTAQAWLDANPPKPIRFADRFGGYRGGISNFVLYDEVGPDAPPPADEEGI